MNPLRAIAVIARTTVIEAVRSRLLWVSVVFAVVLVGLSVAAASVALYERGRLIVDLGLAAASGLGSAVAIAATVNLYAAPLHNRTAYVVLARPLARWAWVAGRFAGLWAAMAAVVAIMGAATAAVVWLFQGEIPEAFAPAVWLTVMEMGLVVAIALLFASFAVPALAATYAGGMVLAGALSEDIAALAQRSDDPRTATALRAAYALLPDLSKLSLRSQAANRLPLPDGYLLAGSGYALCYAALAVVVAGVALTRRRAL